MAIDSINPNVPGLDTALAFRDQRLPGNLQAGAAYIPELADIEKVTRFTGAGAAVYTVPTNAKAPFPFGTILTVARDGTGAVTIGAEAGVTVNRPASTAAAIGAQYSLVNLRKTDTDTWSLFGGLAAA
jgi:hypothetical protein